MPRLRDILDWTYLNALEYRVSSQQKTRLHSHHGLSTSDRQTQKLLNMIREKDALIKRLKETDEKRNGVFRKNMDKWRSKQREVKSLEGKNRTLRRLLKERRTAIREKTQRLQGLENAVAAQSLSQAAPITGEPIPTSFENSPPRNFASLLIRKISGLSNLPWRYWMRIGRYFQYDPRPLITDRIPKPKPSAKDGPSITVVTPSFQQAKYLEKTMQSVLEQEYPNLEYLVMDGGSTDGSVEVIQKHADKLAHWQSEPDGGQSAAIKAGLERGNGEIMAWLNSDDVIFPGTLEYVADYFRQHPEVDVVYGQRIILDEKGYETGRWVMPPHDPELLPWADFIPQECTFWRRRIYEKVGGMDPDFQFAMDWDLFLRFQEAGAKMVRLPYFMGGFRVHPEQKNAVTIGSDGHREMKQIRDRSLGPVFQRGGLQKRLNWLQTKGVLCTLLWRLGIRI